MPLYAGFLNAFIFIILLFVNLSCNTKKNNVSLDNNDSFPNLQQETVVKNTKILFHYESIPSGTCSYYKIISPLDTNFVNHHLKLIDNNNFTLNKKLQKLCAFDANNTPAPVGTSAKIVFDYGKNKIFAELQVVADVPSIVHISSLDLLTEQLTHKKEQVIYKGGNSKHFGIHLKLNPQNAKKDLNFTEELSVVGKYNGRDIVMPIDKVAEGSSDKFYFTIPPEFSYGSYELSLRVKNTPNVEQLFKVQVVPKDEDLNSPEIKKIELYFNGYSSDVILPINTCYYYSVFAIDGNKNKYDITKRTSLYSLKLIQDQNNNGFSLFPSEAKVCAYHNDENNQKKFPEDGSEADIFINYKGKTTNTTVIASEGLGFKFQENNPLSEPNLTAKAGSSTQDFKINLVDLTHSTITSFAKNYINFQLLDKDYNPVELKHTLDTNGDVLFSFVVPSTYQLGLHSFILRLVRYPNITATFNVEVTAP